MALPVLADVTGLAYSAKVITWNSVANAETYEIRFHFGANTDWDTAQRLVAVDVTGTSHTVNSPLSDITILIKAKAAWYDESVNADDVYAPVLSTPANVSNFTYDGSNLDWDAVAGAVEYEVRYSEGSEYEFSTSILVGTYPNDDPVAFAGAENKRFYVIARNVDCVESVSPTTLFVALVLPVLDDVANLSYSQKVLTWDTVANAESYELRYNAGASTDWEGAIPLVNVFIQGLTHTVSEPLSDITILIKAHAAQYQESANADDDYAPALTALGNVANFSYDGANINWDLLAGADEYEVRISSGSENDFQSSSLVGVYPDNTPVPFANADGNRFYIIGRDNDCVESPSASTFYVEIDLPVLGDVTNLAYSAKVITWDAVASAESYVLRYNAGVSTDWDNAIPLTSVPIQGTTHTVIAPLSDITILIKAIAAQYQESDTADDVYAPALATLPDVVNFSLLAGNIVWDAVAGADEYELRYSQGSEYEYESSLLVGVYLNNNPIAFPDPRGKRFYIIARDSDCVESGTPATFYHELHTDDTCSGGEPTPPDANEVERMRGYMYKDETLIVTLPSTVGNWIHFDLVTLTDGENIGCTMNANGELENTSSVPQLLDCTNTLSISSTGSNSRLLMAFSVDSGGGFIAPYRATDFFTFSGINTTIRTFSFSQRVLLNPGEKLGVIYQNDLNNNNWNFTGWSVEAGSS